MSNSQKRENFVQQIEKYMVKMPSLSTTITKVLAVCNSPTASANDLNKVVSLDPVLTGNVLKLINSAYYSMRDQVTSLTQAIIMLGLNTIKNLALSMAVLGAVGAKKSKEMDLFWTHCISTGVTAKAIALQSGVSKSECEEYFVAGLLHDLGKIPLINCFPDDYIKVVEYANKKVQPLHNVEKALFGMNHEEIGKKIAEKWELKGAILQSICFHHHLSYADEENKHVVGRVALADIFCKIPVEDIAYKDMPADARLNELLKWNHIAWSTLTNLQSDIQTEIEKAKVFMQISKGKG